MCDNPKPPVSKNQANQISGGAFVLKSLIDNLNHAFSDYDMTLLNQALKVLEDKKAEIGSLGQG